MQGRQVAHQDGDSGGCRPHVCIGVSKGLADKLHELLQAEAISLAHAKHWYQGLQQCQPVVTAGV